MNNQILIATHNENKVLEFKKILPTINFISLKDLNDTEDFLESGTTFEVNSYLKASYYFEKHRIPTIADDSGLEVKALNNAPGVYSKRYSIKGDFENNLLILKNMEGVTNRKANFKCVITYIKSEDEIMQFEGVLEGEISHEIIGKGGFGYDPIFLIKNYNQTIAELGNEYKAQHSHRAQALLLFKEYLDENTNY